MAWRIGAEAISRIGSDTRRPDEGGGERGSEGEGEHGTDGVMVEGVGNVVSCVAVIQGEPRTNGQH